LQRGGYQYLRSAVFELFNGIALNLIDLYLDNAVIPRRVKRENNPAKNLWRYRYFDWRNTDSIGLFYLQDLYKTKTNPATFALGAHIVFPRAGNAAWNTGGNKKRPGIPYGILRPL
jgi:hypothetical protein